MFTNDGTTSKQKKSKSTAWRQFFFFFFGDEILQTCNQKQMVQISQISLIASWHLVVIVNQPFKSIK